MLGKPSRLVDQTKIILFGLFIEDRGRPLLATGGKYFSTARCLGFVTIFFLNKV